VVLVATKSARLVCHNLAVKGSMTVVAVHSSIWLHFGNKQAASFHKIQTFAKVSVIVNRELYQYQLLMKLHQEMLTISENADEIMRNDANVNRKSTGKGNYGSSSVNDILVQMIRLEGWQASSR